MLNKNLGKLSIDYFNNQLEVRFNKCDSKRFINKDFTDYVYIISNSITKLYKIGITDNYIRRLTDLQNASGCFLDTVLILQLGYNNEKANYIEKFLHNYYRGKRIIGEWFRLDNVDINDIEELFFEIEGEYVHIGGYDCIKTTDDILIEAIERINNIK